ncbi:MAG TPA: CehA/McbA family metallohydrolase [Bryobacteraceae bacterium]|nr:CehA/McbA family metallohydrolase [Bryobacteraceae bacterium]
MACYITIRFGLQAIWDGTIATVNHLWNLLLTWLLLSAICQSQTLKLPGGKFHLRSGDKREWRSFPASAFGRTASVDFQAAHNATEFTLVLRQRDVKKRTWVVKLNGQKLGSLQDDERSMLRILPIPTNTLKNGTNTLQIEGEAEGLSDDIEIANLRIEPFPVERFLSAATISISAAGEGGPMPLRLTIVDKGGTLVPFVSLKSGSYEAQRTGALYTVDGTARIGLPTGEYEIFASRGFEYSAPSQRVVLQTGSAKEIRLRLEREVRIQRYVSADTHVHTFELSRHGDATVDERILTAAGEGLDIVIATEHNRVDDYTPAVKRRNLDRWLFAVPGNEVTTAMGHFNIFPAISSTRQPDPRQQNWAALMSAIREAEGVQLNVQNHPQDLHSGYRPFDSSHHLSSVGTNLNGRPISVNAMEVVNSGAMSSDVMRLVRDWMGLLSRGLSVAAIGSSDTHTVDFVPIGQARTYIEIGSETTKWRDKIQTVFKSLADGRNLVSYGLAAEIRMTGEVQTAQDKRARFPLEITAYGPSWSTADRVEIYSNGQLAWNDAITASRKGGIKYRKKLNVVLPKHDATLIAVVTGPGVLKPFWEVRKPYQPVSDDWEPKVIGVSNALRVDGDNDGAISAPRIYAERIVGQARNVPSSLATLLAVYDRSVAMQALDILRAHAVDVNAAEFREAFTKAGPHIREAYLQYVSELNQIHR